MGEMGDKDEIRRPGGPNCDIAGKRRTERRKCYLLVVPKSPAGGRQYAPGPLRVGWKRFAMGKRSESGERASFTFGAS
jgi:hypothetical protein